ncbi:MAG: metallophosphoesterase, partial [Muribaculaceae bacterium]|nr:metallophosphoesterase [Muribaculaceae bacterium]
MKNLTVAALVAAPTTGIMAESLVILHTNDTHSLIDPDPADGRGGVLQRQAIVDSVRKAEKNVLLVDAGDMVQGTLYFKFFKGDVEYPLMNLAKYDIRILGNHEFDNGLAELARHYSKVKADRLSANYDFSATPLKGMFDPFVIKKVGGKKIGFIGINVDPASLISRENYEGMKFRDIIST